MKAFFSSLLYASIIGGIGAALVGNTYKKHIQSLAALLCTAVMVSPLVKASLSLGETLPFVQESVSADSAAHQKLLTQQIKTDAEKAVADYIFSETGIKVLSVCIDIESEEEELSISALKAVTENETETEAVKALLLNAVGGNVDIEVVCEG